MGRLDPLKEPFDKVTIAEPVCWFNFVDLEIAYCQSLCRFQVLSQWIRIHEVQLWSL